MLKYISDILRKNQVVNKIYTRVRLHKILKLHRSLSKYWKSVNELYKSGKFETYQISKFAELPSEKIIWQYWGQGIHEDNLPEVVKLCFNSVDKFKGDYSIIRLTDDTISQYVNLPDFVWNKKNNNPAFNRTFFSDLLRLALLDSYGGVWLDATILLTSSLPKVYSKMDYFVFQRDPQAKNQEYWENSYAYYWNWHPQFKVRMLNSIIFAKKNNTFIHSLLDLILYYWKHESVIKDYFFFQIAYETLKEDQLKNNTCLLISDIYPHLLQTKFNEPDRFSIDYSSILLKTSIHKLSYFDDQAMYEFRKFIKEYTE